MLGQYFVYRSKEGLKAIFSSIQIKVDVQQRVFIILRAIISTHILLSFFFFFYIFLHTFFLHTFFYILFLQLFLHVYMYIVPITIYEEERVFFSEKHCYCFPSLLSWFSTSVTHILWHDNQVLIFTLAIHWKEIIILH